MAQLACVVVASALFQLIVARKAVVRKIPGNSDAITSSAQISDMPHATEVSNLQGTNSKSKNNQKEVSILESCPLEKLKSSLSWLIESKVLVRSNLTETAHTRYLELAKNLGDQCHLGHEWTESQMQSPMIINVGEGTTGTRWLHRVMRKLGFHSAHNELSITNTTNADKWEYISDWPVPMITWHLAKSHPKAIYWMTMRDPVEWAMSRVRHHSDVVGQACPCGRMHTGRETDISVWAQNYIVYSAWAACVLPRDRLTVKNFFSSTSDVEVFDELVHVVEANGLQKPDWENRVANLRSGLSSVSLREFRE
jgi:hypothetical protein